MPELIQFRPGPMTGALTERAGGSSIDLIAKRDLARYYELLRRELARISLTRDEACLICDAMNGTALLESFSPFYLPMELGDAISLNHLDDKWKVDAEVLLGKVARWTPAQLLAVGDATERFWSRSDEDTDLVLESVGLVRS